MIRILLILLLSLMPAAALATEKFSPPPFITMPGREQWQGEVTLSPVSGAQFDGTFILGEAELAAEDLDAFARRINPSAPPVGKYYIELGRSLGVRGDIAFAQSVLETGYFRHIPAGQNNFAGIGAVGGGAPGHFFDSPAEGVQAQLEHLWAYSTDSPLQFKPVDPRFHLVRRGCAPTWEALGGKWAVPGYSPYRYASFEEAFAAGDTYGQRILKIYAEMKTFAQFKK